MISKCWSQNPKDRPSFDYIFEFLVNYLSRSNEMIDRKEVLDYIDFLSGPEAKEKGYCMIC